MIYISKFVVYSDNLLAQLTTSCAIPLNQFILLLITELSENFLSELYVLSLRHFFLEMMCHI